jgi:hypothetical protein
MFDLARLSVSDTIPCASAGRFILLAQVEFVERYAIAAALGLGGLLPTADVN